MCPRFDVCNILGLPNRATFINPVTTSHAYNGEGQRVQQSVTSGGATTKYYSAGLATVANVNGTLSYLVHDTLGSVSASLTATGGLPCFWSHGASSWLPCDRPNKVPSC